MSEVIINIFQIPIDISDMLPFIKKIYYTRRQKGKYSYKTVNENKLIKTNI